MSEIRKSELILNPDGSVYHLALHPQDIADTIIVVGDPDRVKEVSNYFDNIELTKRKREFITVTGRIGNKRLTVISTGIGPDNIDIVINELDALVNIDLEHREPKSVISALKILRFGTSGSLQAEIPVNSHVVSERAIGIDNLMSYYAYSKDLTNKLITESVRQKLDMNIDPYTFESSKELLANFSTDGFIKGWTVTSPGFYAPQGRVLRLALQNPKFIEKLMDYNYNGKKITNFEMETSAIYGLGSLMGHKCLSINTIVANRANGTFSENPYKAVNDMIVKCLEVLIKH